jgi:hypothetical protein
MSNLQRPPHSVQYLRLKHPRAWRFIQEQITTVLDDPAPMLEQMMARLGREGTLEALEASLDAGTMKFVRCPEDPEVFGLAFYCADNDRYFILAEDGTLRDTKEEMLDWSLGEDDDEE